MLGKLCVCVQTVDYVGRVMYSCLDWGLGADVERVLDETLELLVDQMTKVNIRLGAEHLNSWCLQPICTISKVLQVHHHLPFLSVVPCSALVCSGPGLIIVLSCMLQECELTLTLQWCRF